MNVFLENAKILLGFPFVVRALIAGPLTALSSALLGVGLVTGRKAMLGDGLSHVSFCAVAIALAIGVSPTVISVPAVIIAALLLLRSGSDDGSSVALISGGALAVGTFVLSVVSGMNMDVSDYMFGSIFTLSFGDTVLCIICVVCVLAVYSLLYRRVFAVSFDEAFASASGIHVKRYNSIMAALTAITVVTGMKIMGVMLVTALTVFPALTALQLCKSFRSVVIFASVSSLCCFTLGIIIALSLSLPAGATVVMIYLALLIICFAVKTVRTAVQNSRTKGSRVIKSE